MKKEKEYEDYTEEEKEMIKELVIARLKTFPDNLRLSLG